MKINTEVRFEWKNGNLVEVFAKSFDYQGKIAQCFGGGTAVATATPSYIQETHAELLYANGSGASAGIIDNGVLHLINTSQDSLSPYEVQDEDTLEISNIQAYDPTAALTRVRTLDTTVQSLITGIAETTDWGTYIDTAVAKFSSFSDIDFIDNLSTEISALLSAVNSALSDASITAMVTAFENSKKTRFLKEVSLWSAGMADVGAVHTSSYMIGLALMQSEFSNSVDLYEAQLKKDVYTDLITRGIDSYLKANVLRVQNKDSLMLSGAGMMIQLKDLKSKLHNQLLAIKNDIEKAFIIAEKEELDQQMAIDVEAGLWDLNVIMYGANVLGAYGGASTGVQPPKISNARSALSGAATGAAIGSEFGPWGTAIGAGAGALLGWALN